MNTFEEYEKAAQRTLRPDEEQPKLLSAQQTPLLLGAIGMAAEAGEFLDHVKKHLFHDQPLSEERVLKMLAELGDILWYHMLACRAMQTTMGTVAQGNIDKLLARHPNGVDFGYHNTDFQNAVTLAIEGVVYKDDQHAEYVFSTFNREYMLVFSFQELANLGMDIQAASIISEIKRLAMHRLMDVLKNR